MKIIIEIEDKELREIIAGAIKQSQKIKIPVKTHPHQNEIQRASFRKCRNALR